MGVNPLWKHQQIAVDRVPEELNDIALFMDTGTGKSRTVIEILRKLYNRERRIMRTLIVAPIISCSQWKKEFAKYSKVPQEKIIVLNKAGPKRLADLKEAITRNPAGFIAAVNYEMTVVDSLYSAIKDWSPEIIVYDESHRVKNPSSVRFKKLKPLSILAKHRAILTATPVLNTPLDLFSQYMLLDGGKTFGSNFYVYRAQYLYDKNAGMPKHVYFPKWVIRPGAEKILADILSRTAVRANKKECLDLPPEIDITLDVPMGTRQEKAYLEMKQSYVAFIKEAVREQVITANLAITQTLRMRQILAGFVQTNPDEAPIYFKENPRLDALVEKISDLAASGHKVIVWTDFRPTYKLIGEALSSAGVSSVHLTGDESAKQKEENKEEFTKGNAQVAICNPQAVGLAVELTEASTSFYYTRSYSRDHDEQTKGRNYRGGSEMHEKVTRYYVEAVLSDPKKESLDKVISRCLEGKADLASALQAWANLN